MGMQGKWARDEEEEMKPKVGRPKLTNDARALKAMAETRKKHMQSREEVEEMKKGKKC